MDKEIFLHYDDGDFRIQEIEGKGYGLVAKKNFEAGKMIGDYCGGIFLKIEYFFPFHDVVLCRCCSNR